MEIWVGDVEASLPKDPNLTFDNYTNFKVVLSKPNNVSGGRLSIPVPKYEWMKCDYDYGLNDMTRVEGDQLHDFLLEKYGYENDPNSHRTYNPTSVINSKKQTRQSTTLVYKIKIITPNVAVCGRKSVSRIKFVAVIKNKEIILPVKFMLEIGIDKIMLFDDLNAALEPLINP